MVIFQHALKRSVRHGFCAPLVFLLCAADPDAGCADDPPRSACSVDDPDPVDYAGVNGQFATEWFKQLDHLVAGFPADLAREAPEKLAELADEVLADLTENVPTVYLRAYLAKEIPRAAPFKKEWLQRLFDRVNELRAINMHRDSANALIRESARTRRVSTLLVCLTLFQGEERAMVAETLAHFKEPRVVRCLCKALAGASTGPPSGIGDGAWPLHIRFRNAVIKSLAMLTGLDLAFVRPLYLGAPEENEEQFAARMVTSIREGSERCLDAAVRCVQWLRINEPRAAAMFEADCTAAPAEAPLLAGDASDDAADSFELQRIVYSHVIANLLIVRAGGSPAAQSAETAGRQADELLADMLEAVPIVYVRAYLKRVIPHEPVNNDKELLQRLLDRLDTLRAMDGASARALITDSARQRHISTLLVCFCALRDTGLRSEAAKALAGFKEPRVVRCLCAVLAVMAHCASAEGGAATLDNIALQNAAIQSLSRLTGLDLALVDPPPGGMRDGEGEMAFAARLAAARRDRRDCCLKAARRCEKWLDELQRQDSDSRG